MRWGEGGRSDQFPYQSLLGELLVSDHPGRLALEHLRLSAGFDQVVAKPDFQVGHVVLAHAAR